MRLLVDTHLLLWAASEPRRLSAAARQAIEDEANLLSFSVVSIWEVVIKQGRRGFEGDPLKLRAGLVANDYAEMSVEGRHVLDVVSLPRHHGDPFDRLLVAQARVEGLTLLTSDRALAAYGAHVRLV